ncbi:hypothetical protein BJ508DRAFT_301188 [Ascobolus immersus RN42]|uniref:Uncharacterized protein n=1 Tax=Ascobolus immersus RN42 TaxID=1160509 RepID=A0A3N4IMF7_ASCIM|nr:hypothetical protein BJ508DRAFT_301188 [Ascobolus immersus RN42]
MSTAHCHTIRARSQWGCKHSQEGKLGHVYGEETKLRTRRVDLEKIREQECATAQPIDHHEHYDRDSDLLTRASLHQNPSEWPTKNHSTRCIFFLMRAEHGWCRADPRSISRTSEGSLGHRRAGYESLKQRQSLDVRFPSVLSNNYTQRKFIYGEAIKEEQF